MKKFYTIASALMLAMSMTMMTACSSENDPVTEEKPVELEKPAEPTTRIVTLKATADMGAETRVAVEGIEGMEDAFRISGWKNGDVVKVLALKNDGSRMFKEIPFTYDASTEVFSGDVLGFDLSELKYAYVGGTAEKPDYNIDGKWNSVKISIPIAITNPEDCFLFGEVSEDGESISASLSAPYALACVHNNLGYDIEVGQITTKTGAYIYKGLKYECSESSFIFNPELTTVDASRAEKYTIPARSKAYFVIPPKNDDFINPHCYGLYDFTYDRAIAAPKDNVTIGKVYKVQVTTGSAKATILGKVVGVEWVQLWENGPKWAVYNVGVTDGKPESFGGFYTWGGSAEVNINMLANNLYYEGAGDLPRAYDTATCLWGENWRMPTLDEALDLYLKCDDIEETLNGVKGRRFTGIGDYSSYSIFIPLSGRWDRDFDRGYYGSGEWGDIWTTTRGQENAQLVSLLQIHPYDSGIDEEYPYNARSVRAVLAE